MCNNLIYRLKLLYNRELDKWFVNGDLKRPIIPFTQNLLFWRPKTGGVNVGDELSSVVFEETLKYLKLKRHISYRTTRFSVIGSILSQLPKTETIVWGSGLIFSSESKYVVSRLDNLKIYALRGPNTFNAIYKNCSFPSIAFGDPAILMPLYYSPNVKQIPGKVLIIPHHSKTHLYKAKYENVYDTKTDDWKGFINEILSSEKVISSSLHGIILSECYGIPTLLLDDVPGDYFKYEDYYFSTGRMKFPIVKTVDEGLVADGQILSKSILQNMQIKLLESFPSQYFKPI